jgi:hypothetical protein
VTIGGTARGGPNWKTLIARWQENSRAGSEKLAAPESGYSIFYVLEGTRFRPYSGQVISADSPIEAGVALQLGEDTRPLPDILLAASPVLVATEMWGAAPRGPLAILAWRRVPDGVEVLRRHVSPRELQ